MDILNSAKRRRAAMLLTSLAMLVTPALTPSSHAAEPGRVDFTRCLGADVCKSHGRCSLVEGACVPTQDADCRRSLRCASEGLCTARHGRCGAADDAACAQSQACTADGLLMRRVEASIGLSSDRRQLLVLISDTGPGLPGDFPEGSSDKPGGHGLGLGLCRRIVADMGGEIEVSNIPFGRGAIMQVAVPLGSLART